MFAKVCYNTHMATVNLSITDDQLNWMDSTFQNLGFANRSEFIRSILRFISQREDLLNMTSTFPFQPPPTNNSAEILADFKASGKYSKAFLNDLAKGMKQSTYFS